MATTPITPAEFWAAYKPEVEPVFAIGGRTVLVLAATPVKETAS